MFTGQILTIIIFAIFVLIALIAVAVKKRRKADYDYYAVFVMGLVWIVFGLIFRNEPLGLMGVLFVIAGLVHKKEWSPRRDWDGLSSKEKLMKASIISIAVIAGGVSWFLVQSISLGL